MSRLSNEDMERLANRVAMLASDDGEADNAGRAVGQLARRLGLTGGDLKHMFLEGARPQVAAERARAGEVERLEREIEDLKRTLRNTEAAARVIQWERDELLATKGELSIRLYRNRATARAQRIGVAVGVAVLVLVAGGIAYYGPDIGGRQVASRPAGSLAVVRASHAVLLRDPVRGSPLVAPIPVGTRLVVRRVMWNMMTQWAEVEMGTVSGYVPTTDLEMF